MKNIERQKLIDRIAVLEKRIISLNSWTSKTAMADIMEETITECNRLAKIVNSKREYVYSFSDGGWNTEYAYTEEEAYDQAIARWSNNSVLVDKVVKSSFHLANRNEVEQLMRMSD